MKKIATISAGILVFAIALFFIGPPLGSLDTDGDGIPDVPVMVVHVRNGQNVHPTQSDGQGRIILTIAWPFLVPTSNDLGFTHGRNTANARSAVLDSVTPLRC
jgi:hypothetical protein